MLLKNKKVFITGADGFIGSHLVETCLNEGAQVKALVYYNSFNSWGWLDSLPAEKKEKIEIVVGDVRDPFLINKAIACQDIVFHLAALIGIPYSYVAPDHYVDTNVKGTLNVLQAARDHGHVRVIHTSTSEVYGTAQSVPISESHPIHPQSPYAATKSAADHLADSFYLSFDLPVTILRPFNTFGPRQSARAVIPTIISQVLSGKEEIALGNLTATRDFNYVQNTVDSFIAVALSEQTVGKTLNSGSQTEISIGDLVQLISQLIERKIEIKQDEQRLRPEKSEVERLVCDASQLESLTNWKPSVSLNEGLLKTIEWIEQNLNSYKVDLYNV